MHLDDHWVLPGRIVVLGKHEPALHAEGVAVPVEGDGFAPGGAPGSAPGGLDAVVQVRKLGKARKTVAGRGRSLLARLCRIGFGGAVKAAGVENKQRTIGGSGEA